MYFRFFQAAIAGATGTSVASNAKRSRRTPTANTPPVAITPPTRAHGATPPRQSVNMQPASKCLLLLNNYLLSR